MYKVPRHEGVTPISVRLFGIGRCTYKPQKNCVSWSFDVKNLSYDKSAFIYKKLQIRWSIFNCWTTENYSFFMKYLKTQCQKHIQLILECILNTKRCNSSCWYRVPNVYTFQSRTLVFFCLAAHLSGKLDWKPASRFFATKKKEF